MPDGHIPISHGRKRRSQASFTIWEKPEADDGCGLETLLKYVARERHNDLLRYVKELVATDNYDHTFLGFISDYIAYASLLNDRVDVHENVAPWDRGLPAPPPLTVYDVGCAGALQHLVFDPRIHYVGIDMLGEPEPKFFRDNCRFVRGKFTEVCEGLKIDPRHSVGIANMSLLYFESDDGEAAALFDRTFTKKFVL